MLNVIFRVLRLAVDPDFKMQVRARGHAGAAHPANSLPLLHGLTMPHRLDGQMGIEGRHAAAMFQHYHFAVTAHVLHITDSAALGGPYRGAGGGGDVNTGM